MPTYVVELARPVPAAHGEQLARRVYYLAPDIDTFDLVHHGDEVVGVRVTTTGDADPAMLARRLDEVNDAEVRPQRLVTPEVAWRSPHAVEPADGVFDALVTGGIVHQMGDGAIAVGPPFTTVLAALDARVTRIAVERFGAVEYRYPTLISTDTLRRGGYLNSFPQLIMSAGRLCADIDVYRAFVAALERGDDPANLLQRYGTHTGYCLPPTMCFHTYKQFSGQTLPVGTTVITARGKSFRFESRYHRSLERLWDFTIREIVVISDEASAAGIRAEMLAAACELAEELGLAGTAESAEDPFFAGPAVPRRALAQRLNRLKYELRLPAEQGRMISVASFNVHGTTFGEPYGILLPDGAIAHTACAGFGLERLTFAFFCRYGADIAGWPARLRAEMLGDPR